MVMPKAAKNALERLLKDQRMVPVHKKLEKWGINKNSALRDDKQLLNKWVEKQLCEFAKIFAEWEFLEKNLAIPKTADTRRNIINNLRALAAEIESDKKWTDFHVGQDTPGRLPFSEYLHGAVDSLEKALDLQKSMFDVIQERYPPKKRSPDALKFYALRRVFDMLEALSNKRTVLKRAPNKETEIIVSVLLDTPISTGTVTQMRKKTRRHYWIPEK